MRLKLLGQISHSHSRPPKSHSFQCQVSHFSLFAIFTSPAWAIIMHKLTIQLLNLHIVHCESHRFHKQKIWQLCSIASLPIPTGYSAVFMLADGMSHSKLANLTPNSCRSHYFGCFKVERSEYGHGCSIHEHISRN